MKKLKIKKLMTSFLLLVFMAVSIIGVIPNTNAYASEGQYTVKQFHNFTTDELKGIYDTYSYQPQIGDVKSYCAYNSSNGKYTIFFVSKRTFGVDVKKTDYKGNITSYSTSSSSCSTCMPSLEQGVMNYQSFGFEQYSSDSKFAYRFSNNLGRTLVYTDDLSESDLIMIILGGKTNDSCYWLDSGDTDGGTAGNPIEDKNIGRLVILKGKAYFFNTEKYRQQVETIQWAKKSDSGFSLLHNDYALTRIEVKIGNRNKVYGDIEGHGKPIEVDNFDKVYPFKYVSPKDNPYDFGFTDMMSASKTDLTKYNPSMLAHEYDLYFRIVCSDAIGTSAKFYCGEWTRYRVTDAVNQDGNNESDNGHFDDDGKWIKDEDTYVDSGGISSVTDDDEKDEDFDAFDDPENFTPNIDNIKSFINQLGNVPKAISKLFSFLPSWVTDYIAFGFVVLVALMIVKAIRG